MGQFRLVNSKDMEVEGERSDGRPTLRCMDTIRRDIKKNGLPDDNILDSKYMTMSVGPYPGRPTDV